MDATDRRYMHATDHQKDIIERILEERARQDAKWGPQYHDPIYWLAILGEEFGEVAQAALKARYEAGGDSEEVYRLMEYSEELIQLLAVGMAMAERVADARWQWSEPVYYDHEAGKAYQVKIEEIELG